MSAPAGPRLVRPDERAEPPDAAGRDHGGPRSQRLWVGLGLVLALALLFWGGFESRRAAGLERQVISLTAALERARAEVEAHRRHLDAVRAGMADLEGRIAELRALAGRDPAASPPE